MDAFLEGWADAATTTLGLFWSALWAFALGYLVSSAIQVFVTRARMQRAMGETGPRTVGLATLFGFLSSSCSFSALSTTRAIFARGAGMVPALAFMLASTNLVVELGIVIAMFLSWHFVVGEYVGGVLLILLTWLVVRATLPDELEDQARERARAQGAEAPPEAEDWKQRLRSKAAWRELAETYVMEWQMVWKDVTVGFTVAGLIAAFVPREAFATLFAGGGDASFLEVLLHSVVGPIAALFTFIGSMGNVPLAAVLFGNGVSFAGVMAFLFSDLVVVPVIRIQAQYYGWKMALYLTGVLFVVLVATALLLHYGFAAADLLPDTSTARSLTDRTFFEVDWKLALNLIFLVLSFGLLGTKWRASGRPKDHGSGVTEGVLFWLSMTAYAWLAGGVILSVAGVG